ALTRVATPEDEERLLGVGRGGTAAQVERIVRGWRRVDRQAEAKESARQHATRALHVYEDEDGTVVLRGRLAPEVGALLRQALAAACETLYQQRRHEATATSPTDASAETPSRAQQQADALALLAETALHQGLDLGGPGERYQVVVHVDAPVLADPDQPGQSVLAGGTRVSAETSRRLACDASRVVMRHDADGRIVEIGARSRDPLIRFRPSGRGTTRRASDCTRGRRARAGWGSAWISAGRSTSCIPWPREARDRGRESHCSRCRRARRSSSSRTRMLPE